MNLNLKELRQNKIGVDYEDGYRIVYFYNDNYEIGEYCKSIDGFMIGFAECDPMIDDNDIPKFISTRDLLNRYLEEIDDVISVAIYDVNGICIDKMNRVDKKIKN